ncbi:MAG: flagellar basal-body rod protein FlgF [Terriglobales bacterium]|jgi:flagellar basal-body rod protein FlgF/flagellar basal-body rod protein FlgG|nr:flagellar basal-body rod protein FlgF [Terriglobales bacterium]
MDSGFYAACAALMARSQALDLVANNLANTSTPGYRGQHNIFRSFLAMASGHPGSGLNQAVNDFGISGGSQMDLTQGNLEHTGNDFDFAIQGPGFFKVQTTNGPVFTRNGNFQVSAQGQLITAQGDPVLGENGIIRIVGGPVTVSPDGTISVNGAVAGRVKLVEFPPGTALESVGKTYYSAPAKSDVPAKQSTITQGSLESSNVNPVASAVELVAVQRYAEMMQRALAMFHSEFNRIATDELPRVNP